MSFIEDSSTLSSDPGRSVPKVPSFNGVSAARAQFSFNNDIV